MGLFKKVEIPKTPPRVFKPKPKGEKSPSIRKELGLTPSLIKKTVEQLYAERGILVVHFSITNIKGFTLSEDGRFGIVLSKENRRFTLFFFKADLRKELRENPGVYTSLLSLAPLTELIEDFEWEKKERKELESPDAALRRLRDKIMILMADEIEERLKKQRQAFGFIEPEEYIKENNNGSDRKLESSEHGSVLSGNYREEKEEGRTESITNASNGKKEESQEIETSQTISQEEPKVNPIEESKKLFSFGFKPETKQVSTQTPNPVNKPSFGLNWGKKE